MDWGGRRVLVLGLGRTGRSAAAFLAARGARVVGADEAAIEPPPPEPGVRWVCGVPFPEVAGFDVVVPSPGVPPARYAGAARVCSDVEIAARSLAAPVVAVTGSNGKTTAVLLIEAMLRRAGLRARAAGNVGLPALALVGEPLDVAVLEVSSFQLESTTCLRPHVGVALNLAADHLDRHGSFAAYAAAKARLFAHQREDDWAVLNADDEAVVALAAGSPARRGLFSLRRPVPDGAWLEADAVVYEEAGQLRHLPRPAAPVAAEALLAGVLGCRALDVDVTRAAQAWAGFVPPPHRRERVAERRGVTWVNDSKATNPSAACHALAQCRGPVVWIAGGRAKGELELDALVETAARCVRAALWIGEASEPLEHASAGRFPNERAADLGAAVARAAALAEPGDTVLLSPAFASFDQFRDFEERGECFRRAVAALAEGA